MSTMTMTRSGKSKARELGDLGPIRVLLEELQKWEHEDRERRGEDEVVHALTTVRRRLAEAIAKAEDPHPELSVEEYAKLTGISVWAAYKRISRGKVPGAKKDAGGNLVIPMEAVA